MTYEINQEKLDDIKARVCDDICYWRVFATDSGLELHCAKCPLNDFDYPLGKNDYQE